MTKPIEFSGLSSALFSGVEAEGPPRFRGVPTLFVRGDVPLEKILQHRNGNERIYFGAPRNRGGPSASTPENKALLRPENSIGFVIIQLSVQILQSFRQTCIHRKRVLHQD
jgi:hypothetical protein